MELVPQARASRARWGVALLFFVNAVAFASIVPRYVELRETFSLDNATFGLVIASGPVGALAAGLIAGRLLRSIGSAPTAVVSSMLLGLNLIVISMASDGWTLALALFIAGILDSTGDIGNNAHGLRVQRALGKSVISGLHGVWSVGAIVGGSVAALALANGVPIGVQLVTTGILIALLSLAAGVLVRLPAAPAPDRPSVAPTAAGRFALWPFLAIVGIGIAGALLEDIVSTWGGIYLVDIVGAGTTTAGAAFIAFMCALTLGRLVGDAAIDRWGPGRVLTVGAWLAATGFVLALAVPASWTSLAGFALVGIGIATMIPSAMQAADQAPGLRAGVGLTISSLVMRVGFLAPPLIGAFADATSLRLALLSAPAVALSVVALARVSTRVPE
ncbi:MULTISPECIES: MFS transporter [unclassified Microbacterium]|uniref:MFS transporter n=1 Tax=unclassified Microbacterium TaxID=2609290 RepID=UPI00214BB82B|nr:MULTISPECIES: MFS transporter [unclassified Microbacterium]MCR2784619.1 MFS transporter [Microbacterium sp. zg.B96]WIM16162.1 MFS transporter [Microbacterium sp. zg-B96]